MHPKTESTKATAAVASEIDLTEPAQENAAQKRKSQPNEMDVQSKRQKLDENLNDIEKGGPSNDIENIQ